MLRRLPLLLCALVAAVSTSIVVAPAALAQEDEVFVDPGSPSGKEYALPINRARQQAGTSTKKGSGSREAPLFGEGVERSATGATRSAPKAAGGKRTKDSDSERRKPRAQADGEDDAAAFQEARDAEAARTRALRSQAAAAPEGGIGIGGVLGAGIAVLLVGGLVGLWLRRRATT